MDEELQAEVRSRRDGLSTHTHTLRSQEFLLLMIMVQECGSELVIIEANVLLSCLVNLVLAADKRVKEPRGRAHPSSFLTPPCLSSHPS